MEEVDQHLIGLLNKHGVDRALITNLLGYTVKIPGKALKANNGAPHNKLDPRYVGESKIKELYSEIDLEHVENNGGAP